MSSEQALNTVVSWRWWVYRTRFAKLDEMKKLILACTVSYIIQILSRVFCKSKHWIFMASIVKYYTLCHEMQLKVSVGTVSGVEHFAKLYN